MPEKKKKTIQPDTDAATLSDEGKQDVSLRHLMSDLRSGRTISYEIFRRNAWLMVAIIIVVLSLIGMRYKTKTNMQVIKKLETELERAKSLKISEKAQYMTLIRESEMKELVRKRHLNLEYQDKPPYEIYDPEN